MNCSVALSISIGLLFRILTILRSCDLLDKQGFYFDSLQKLHSGDFHKPYAIHTYFCVHLRLRFDWYINQVTTIQIVVVTTCE